MLVYAVSGKCMFNLQHRKLPFTCFARRHIMKHYLGLESKSLEDVVSLSLRHMALALIALVLALEFAA